MGLIMGKIKITLKRSLHGRKKKQILTAQALGLRSIGKSVERETTREVMGMVNVISHMVDVQECD